jgi:hypothetical protein
MVAVAVVWRVALFTGVSVAASRATWIVAVDAAAWRRSSARG